MNIIHHVMELHIKKVKHLTGKGHFNQNPGVNVTEKDN